MTEFLSSPAGSACEGIAGHRLVIGDALPGLCARSAMGRRPVHCCPPWSTTQPPCSNPGLLLASERPAPPHVHLQLTVLARPRRFAHLHSKVMDEPGPLRPTPAVCSYEEVEGLASRRRDVGIQRGSVIHVVHWRRRAPPAPRRRLERCTPGAEALASSQRERADPARSFAASLQRVEGASSLPPGPAGHVQATGRGPATVRPPPTGSASLHGAQPPQPRAAASSVSSPWSFSWSIARRPACWSRVERTGGQPEQAAAALNRRAGRDERVPDAERAAAAPAPQRRARRGPLWDYCCCSSPGRAHERGESTPPGVGSARSGHCRR